MARALVAGVLGLIAAAAVAEEAKPTTSPFKDGETVVFWGDSITQQAKWIRFLTDFYHTRYPDRKITYRNAGIAGNSFGGGIKEIDRDVAPWKPTTVFTMFGMNDSAAAGPYHPGWPSTDEEKAKLRQRVDRGYQVDAACALKDLKAKCGADLRIVMMTPSIYDSTARTPKEKPVNDGWNTTLGESGKKLIAGYEAGKWELVDLWEPMTKFNAWAQAMNPNFSIVSAQERVHPDDNGGWFMAQQILKAQGADRTVSEIRFDAAKGKVRSAKRAKVSDVRKTADGWTMKVREEALPFPTAKSVAEVAVRSKWSDGYGPDSVINYEWFAAEGLAKGVWELSVDDTLVWRGTDGEFAFGVNLGKNPDTPQMEQAKRVTEKNRLRHEKESRLRALASLRWWLPMGKKVKDPDDVAEVGAWMAANPDNKGLFGRGQYMKEYLVEWPKRKETYVEIEAMDAEIERLRQPVERTWKLVQVEKGERDNPPAKRVTERRELFNGKDLSGWYKYLTGRGRDNDPLGVFSVKDGVISIHGLGNGCITTKEAFRDYRVQVEYRWVGKSYQGRAWKCHDSGLLFHSRGPDGMYHGTWKWSFEANMIQSRTPDLITVVLRGYRTPKDFTYKATVDVDANDTWTSGGTPKACVNSGHWHNKFTPVPWRDLKANPTVPPEKPMGEWNVLEVVAKGDRAEFFLNGEKTLEAYGLSPTEGQLQIQSEGSDCEVRRVTLLPLDTAPAVPEVKAEGWIENRQALKRVFMEREYGVRPVERPSDLRFETSPDAEILGGKAVRREVKLSMTGPRGPFSFTAVAYLPKGAKKVASFVYVYLYRTATVVEAFDRRAEDPSTRSFPVADIIRRGYAAVAFVNAEVALDWREKCFSSGVFAAWGPGPEPSGRKGSDWGAISAWAWGASRVLDWIETQPDFDARRVAVIGHSRGGKTALWAGVTDERFALACVNESGCSGAKLNHMDLPKSEPIATIVKNFPHWFCPNYFAYAGKEMEMDFDQHQLVALMAPRAVAVADATLDDWAGQAGEFRSCELASPAWAAFGKKGLVAPEGMPKADTAVQDGWISYHLRTGKHELTPFDWQCYMDFADRRLASAESGFSSQKGKEGK